MSTRTVSVRLYRDAAKKWRWHAIRNSNILADSGQGYSRRIDCLSAMSRVLGITYSGITWLDESPAVKFGQAQRTHDVVEVIVWKLYVDKRVGS